MIMESTLRFIQASNPGIKLWRVIGDEDNYWKWGNKSRTLTVRSPVTGDLFDQLPAVYGYSWEYDLNPDNYRVNEEPLRDDYIRINNYDGNGLVRCQNYLWKDNTALYNGQGFPGRELLTMSGNALEEIEWIQNNGSWFLKFKTIKPGDSVDGYTWEAHPQFVHRFTLVFWDAVNEVTRYTYNTPRGNIFYFLSSPGGFGIMPERYVRKV